MPWSGSKCMNGMFDFPPYSAAEQVIPSFSGNRARSELSERLLAVEGLLAFPANRGGQIQEHPTTTLALSPMGPSSIRRARSSR